MRKYIMSRYDNNMVVREKMIIYMISSAIVEEAPADGECPFLF
jgi:hypothetical protein